MYLKPPQLVALTKLITMPCTNLQIHRVSMKIHAVEVVYILLFCYNFLLAVMEYQWFWTQKCLFRLYCTGRKSQQNNETRATSTARIFSLTLWTCTFLHEIVISFARAATQGSLNVDLIYDRKIFRAMKLRKLVILTMSRPILYSNRI